MSPPCDCCGEYINKLNQQVSVMRKEIKNLRQMLDSAVRAHRKHLTSVQAAVSRIGSSEDKKELTPSPCSPSPRAGLEQGNIQTVPIGYISSCFSMKNGTPRQPTVCGPSRAQLRLRQSVFNNPEHALEGLEQYSHVWIIFLFHKNGHLSYKAKVKPPRLNGQRAGVYSTRSPHRPNALGLTLAKLDKIEGDTVHLLDIDMIAGTPVLDIKPYIPQYDSPDTRINLDLLQQDSDTDQQNGTIMSLNKETSILNLNEDSDTDAQFNIKRMEDDVGILASEDKSETGISEQFLQSKDLRNFLVEVETFVTQEDTSQHGCESKSRVSDSAKPNPSALNVDHPCYGEEAYTTIAGWIREPPVASLDVRFTPHAEKQLAEFLPSHLSVSLTQDPLKVTDPALSFCVVQRRLQLPSRACCRQTPGQCTGGVAAETDSSSSPSTRLTSPAGLDKVSLKYCRSDLLSATLPQCENTFQ
ncbi:tRNA (adenine(37)-N6)-methyltransferase isoform 1-T1 [Odontesthes bonariensis]|uniref:tRNA (adenine(37)-N6)-methyltransferase isoform X1 n=1 Tax=Odontesthes bonariensis TaxID=219752 RepID=UPI003F583668